MGVSLIDEQPSFIDFGEFISLSNSYSSYEFGDKLLSFFKYGYSINLDSNSSYIYKWKIPNTSEIITHNIFLNEADLEYFKVCCKRAYHHLSFSCSWIYLLDNAVEYQRSSISIKIELSSSMTKYIRDALDFHSLRLGYLSGAHVKLSENESKLIVIEAFGTFRQIQKLKIEINRYIYLGRFQSYGNIRSLSSLYFVEGCNYLYSKGAGIHFYYKAQLFYK